MRLLLIRHAERRSSHGPLPGRTAGVDLTEQGLVQAERLARRLAALPISAIYSSPLERALQTAAPLASRLNLAVQVEASLTEIDFGDWTEASAADLEGSSRWRQFNSFRSGTRAPAGETMLDVQVRMVAEIERLRCRHEGATVAVFSHGDPIRAALIYFAGIPIDLFQRIEISFASVSELTIDDESVCVWRINDTGDLA